MKINTILKSIIRLQLAAAFCLLLTFTTQAQPTFIKSIGGMFDEYGTSMLQTDNGDFISSGFSYTTETENEDFYMLKTDINGNTIWSETYGEQLLDWSYSVIETRDGGYLMCGESNTYGTGILCTYLVKTDSDGGLLWKKRYYGEYSSIGRAVVQPDDSSYVFCSSTRKENDATRNIYLAKINLVGDTIWTKSIGGPDDDWPMSMVVTQNGELVVCGGTRNTGNGIEDVYIIKTDALGNLLWENNYGSHTYDAGSTIIKTSDGGFAVCGSSTNSTSGALDFIVLKIDSEGNEMWKNYFGDEDAAWGMSIAETSDAGFVACGAIRHGVGTDLFVWLVKVDENGNEEWNKELNIADNIVNFGMDIISTQDGGLAVCGYTKSEYNQGYYDLLLIKADEQGIVTSVETIEPNSEFYLKISPNPSSGKFFVEIPKGGTNIKIFNNKGALLVEETLMENPEKSIRNFDLSTFGKGMYFVKTYTEGKTFSGKVVVE